MLTNLAAFGGFGFQEILLILLILVLIFGARKLPELGRGLGEGLKNFRKGIREATDKDADKTGTGQDEGTRPS